MFSFENTQITWAFDLSECAIVNVVYLVNYKAPCDWLSLKAERKILSVMGALEWLDAVYDDWIPCAGLFKARLS